MRVCDKCRTQHIARTMKDMKDGTEYDLCADCYTILSDWMYNPSRRSEGDGVEINPTLTKKRR